MCTVTVLTTVHNCEFELLSMRVCVPVHAGVYRLMHAVLFHIGHRTSFSVLANP